ncbi:hypothetical protein, partial [Leptotrichia sp. OH3620_COT-345]|uniref:hypothetical protein n=1 Tax=Leptotrichia sp. OH3620_COT-345 TaxID=2491048 RepID=UPI0013156C7C
MTINVLRTILQNIERMDIYSIFKMLLPGLIKNLIVGFILVTPVTGSSKLGIGGSRIGNIPSSGTLLTQFTEMIFTMFYRLGTLFFNDSKFNNISPGELADLFISRPLTLLQDVFGFMTFFAIFTNIAKIILLLFSLWLCGKIIATYIANIFMALMLTTFSMFYLIFLTMESTVHIGQKGINIIIVQSVTLFMTVAMMGISYQVMKLIVVGNSVQGIASMAVVLFMLQQVMENVSMMAISITSGGGLGTSNGSAFLGLSQAIGMMVGGLAMWGGAKMDELTNNEGGIKKSGGEKDSRDYILGKARENVGLPLLNEVKSSGYQLGVNYSKGYHKSNMKRAEDSFERLDKKRRSGLGVGTRSGMLTATFIQGMTGDLTNKELLGTLWNKTGSLFVNSESKFEDIQGVYPYNVINYEKQREKAIDMIREGWRNLWGELSSINLLSGGGLMSEGARNNAYNNTNNTFSGGKSRDTENFDIPFNPISRLSNNYIEELERLNRNNIERISEWYMNPEDMKEVTGESLEEYKRRNYK